MQPFNSTEKVGICLAVKNLFISGLCSLFKYWECIFCDITL